MMKAKLEIYSLSRKKYLYLGKMHTPVYNFLKILEGFFGAADQSHSATNRSVAVTNTAGSSANFVVAYYSSGSAPIGITPFIVNAFSGDDGYGIWVGKGTSPYSPTDYTLASKYSHGSSIDKMLYGDTTITPTSYGSGQIVLMISRSFTNGYTDAQTLSECGLVCAQYWWSYTKSEGHRVLIIRDVLGSPLSINPNENFIVRYKLYTTY
jgi:hypothetical protein